jgi:outer membrane lipoprotein-sorting protein
MRRGRLPALLALTALVLAAGSPASAQTQAQTWNLARLMAELAQHRGGRVAFTERKFLAILDRPVESSGELVYAPPARLEKRTSLPQPESLVLDGNVLVVERGKQHYTLQLQQYPAATAFVDSIRSTLNGDLAALERQYRVVLDGAPQRWTLTLLPSDERLAALIQRVRITGAGAELAEIETLLTDGDRSVMILRPIARP